MSFQDESGVSNVRYGSKADIGEAVKNVRFTPESGHWGRSQDCPLLAKSGHRHVETKAAAPKQPPQS
jgi:hypothetical protein